MRLDFFSSFRKYLLIFVVEISPSLLDFRDELNSGYLLCRMDVLLELASLLRERSDLGFLFIGRGSEVPRLRSLAQQRGLANVHFHDEIDPATLPDLLRQCSVGLLALDRRHRSHNIPGKFLTYMRSGLPVLASVNQENDLVELIESYQVGASDVSGTAHALLPLVDQILLSLDKDPEVSKRCRACFAAHFSASAAAEKLVATLRSIG
jgi:glycosyltransferase involved in cell wall biosynthesis